MEKDNWETDRLGNLCDVVLGRTPSRSKKQYWGIGTPWVSIRDMSQRNISETKEQITKEGAIASRSRLISEGTLLMSFKLSVGKLAFAVKDIYTNEAIAGLPIKDLNRLDKNYLYYLLQNIPLVGGNQAVMGQTLNKSSLEDLKIHYPKHLNDQKRIAQVLSDCEELIERRKESIALLDELVKSTFLEMFGNTNYDSSNNTTFKLSELCLNIVDCPHTTPKYVKEISNYPCIRTSEIKNGTIDWSSMKYTNQEVYDKRIERLQPKYGDIVFAREGTVGDAAIIPENVTLSLGQRVMMLRVDTSKVLPIYFWALLRSDYIQHVIKIKTVGATVNRINMSEVKKLECQVPPLKSQIQFQSKIERIQELKSICHNHLKELENLYARLSQDAFKGELDLSGFVFRGEEVISHLSKVYQLKDDEELGMAAEESTTYKSRNKSKQGK